MKEIVVLALAVGIIIVVAIIINEAVKRGDRVSIFSPLVSVEFNNPSPARV